jgi:glycosyltransferase involved in cell wall biosynthesis
VKYSFIIPAYNEEQLIAAAISSINDSLAESAISPDDCEIIVVDNNSTDSTPSIAKSYGAQVIFEPVNQIGRARNAGAAVASGVWLIFMDADCELSPQLLDDVEQLTIDGRYIGCGSLMRMDDVPLLGGFILSLWMRISRLMNWAAGSFIVCSQTAFESVGGFSNDLYAAEEIDLSRRLKRYARQQEQAFTILTENPLYTSSRKMHLYSSWELLAQLARLVFMPRKSLKNKESLSMWYDGRR